MNDVIINWKIFSENNRLALILCNSLSLVKFFYLFTKADFLSVKIKSDLQQTQLLDKLLKVLLLRIQLLFSSKHFED